MNGFGHGDGKERESIDGDDNGAGEMEIWHP